MPLPPSPDAPHLAPVAVGADQVQLLRDGAQAYPAMLTAIAGATSTVCLETYILRDDRTGRRFLEALKERARAGVEVSLLYDDWGSTVADESLSELVAAGGRFLAFRPVALTNRFGRILARLRRRNHRKTLIIDGRIGFTGGLNIADDYAAVADGGNGWRDTHVRIEGPSAAQLEALFLDTWRRHRGAPFDPSRYLSGTPAGNLAVRIVGNSFRQDRKDIRTAYQAAFVGAQKRIFLTHAYFLPPLQMILALRRAARRGVEVSIILAGTTDVRLVLFATRGLYGSLLHAGIRVFEYQGRVLHAKTAVVDWHWLTVGSSNLDRLSLAVNLEVNAVFEDATLGAQAEQMFADDLTHCKEVSYHRWLRRGAWDRFTSWFANKFRNWL